MQFVNDDMDELFRKAAENYPLKTDNADWNKVLQGMQKDDGPHEPGNNKTNYRRFLWLLLLLPLAFVCNRYAGSNKDAHKEEIVNNTPATQQGATENKKESNTASSIVKADEQNEKTITPAQPDQTVATGKSVITENNKTSVYKRSATLNNTKPDNATDNKTEQRNLNAAPVAKNQEDKSLTSGENSTAKEENTSTVNGEKNNTGTTNNNTSDAKQENTVVTPAPVVSTEEQKKEETATAKQAEKPKKEKPQLKKGFYLSVLGGPDISTIKLQQVQKVGYSIGLMGGYRITRNFGVELGVLWDKKQYYTDGDQFSTSKIYLPPNVSIKDVAGNCTMIEIPLAARYDFAIKKNSNFFTTLGMSSYLMSKEKYDYMYDHNNNVYGVHREYNSTSKSWFSVIHASVGYEKKIGAIGNLRLEPYLKIPLAGVGVGSLPISSVGMYIGVTKHF